MATDYTSLYRTQAARQGLSPIPNENDFASLYPVVAARNKPPNTNDSFSPVCEVYLRFQRLIYWKTNYVPCPAGVVGSGFTSGQVVGLAGSGAQLGVSALSGAGVIAAGAATAGIGLGIAAAVAGIEGIFSHHAQAVANEQATICGVVGYFNSAIAQINAAVASGQISAADGVNFLKQVVNQGISGLASIEQSCNAACYFKGFLNAFLDFSRQYYGTIGPPVAALRPGQAPTAFGSLPGGVPSVANNVAPPPPVRSVQQTFPPSAVDPGYIGNSGSSAPYNQPTGSSGQLKEVPPVATTNWTVLGIAAIVLLGLLLTFRGGG